MIIKTKKYQLEPKVYRKLAMGNINKQMWWVYTIPVALTGLSLAIGEHWIWILALVATVLWLAFWWIQFTGISSLPQYKTMFERYSYDIDSRQIMMKVNPRQGMPITWDKIQRAKREKGGFVLYVGKAQLFYFPKKIFNNDAEIKFLESILKRKELIK